jgi:hypothetical protein
MVSRLLYGVDDGLESLGIVHCQVCQNLAVEADVLLRETAHDVGVGDGRTWRAAVVDALDPQGAEFALLSFSVTVCVGETFFVGVLRNRPNVLPGQEVAAVLERIFLRRALEATELTDLGINFYFFGGSGFPGEALSTAFQLNMCED